MTETAPPPPAPPPAPLLARDPGERVVAGVCAAVARHTGTDPVLWRVVTVVLAVFGGTGLVLYLLGWLLIPAVGADRSVLERWLRRESRFAPVTIGIVAVVVALLFAGLDDGDALLALVVLGGIGYLVHRQRQGRPLVPPYVPPPVQPGEPEPAYAVPPLERPARGPRSRLGAVTLSVAALATGLLVLLRTYGVESLTPSRIVATAIVVVAGGLVVGAWYGRARWLVLVGLLLCIVLAGTALTDEADGALRGGIGERTWVVQPTDARQGYRLGAGEATLDLTGLEPTGRHLVVDAHVGAGHLIVLVPDDVPVRVHAEVRLGEIRDLGSTYGDVEHVERTESYGPPGDPRVEVEATVGTGQVEVRRG